MNRLEELRLRLELWIWNTRFGLARRILPGNHAHVSVAEDASDCLRCLRYPDERAEPRYVSQSRIMDLPLADYSLLAYLPLDEDFGL